MALDMKPLAFIPITALASLLWLTGCADEPAKKAEAPKEPEKIEPITGNKAFFSMYVAARGWATDASPIQVNSIPLEGVPDEPGKAGAWQATFVSQSLRRSRPYTYSVIEGPGNLHKGVFAGLEESWSGPRGSTEPFLMQALKVDTDAALQTALKKGKNVQEYIKKNPDKKILFILEKTKRHPNPSWRVLWGDSISTSNYSVFVDASTGEYLETMR